MFSILGLLKAALTFVNLLAGIVKDKQLMDAGESKQIAKSFADIQVTLGIVERVADEVEALSDAEVDAELEKLGEFR